MASDPLEQAVSTLVTRSFVGEWAPMHDIREELTRACAPSSPSRSRRRIHALYTRILPRQPRETRQFPTPPHVAYVCGRPQSLMFLLEHASPGAHPVGVAARSQSCASLFPHAVWQSDAAPLFTCRTQHTRPTGQFAVALHLSAVPLPPPPVGVHDVPLTHP